MFFLLRASPKPDVPPSPSITFLEQVVKEWETVLDYKQEGKVVEVFRLADGSGAISIWNVASEEILSEIVSRLPMYPYANWEITPLFTAEETLEQAKIALEKLRSS